MRICYLNHTLDDRTGAGRFGLNFIERISRAFPGVTVRVLTSVASGDLREAPLLFSNTFQLLRALPAIRSEFKQSDIIHALDGFPYGVIAALASLGLGKKLVITAIGTGAIQPFQSSLKRFLLRWAYRRAHRIVAVSRYTKRKILAEVPDLDITVINHGVDIGEFSEDRKDERTENEKLEVKKLKPYILSVGSGKKRKGFEYSFSAFAQVTARFPGLRYVVVGIGPKLYYTEPLGITGRVHYFKGVRWPFLKELYRNAELFMLLPHEVRGDVEGFGFVFLEAAAAGIPVVGTYDSGAEDAIRHGENGFLVPPRSPAAAADAAVKILSDPMLKEKFSNGSMAFARKMSFEKVIIRYRNLYQEILQ